MLGRVWVEERLQCDMHFGKLESRIRAFLDVMCEKKGKVVRHTKF